MRVTVFGSRAGRRRRGRHEREPILPHRRLLLRQLTTRRLRRQCDDNLLVAHAANGGVPDERRQRPAHQHLRLVLRAVPATRMPPDVGVDDGSIPGAAATRTYGGTWPRWLSAF